MTDSFRHLVENRPKEAIAQLKANSLAENVLKRARTAMEQLYMTAETDADRDTLWSDLKWQTGLFPPEEPKQSEKARKEVNQWLATLGGMPHLIDAALKKANLGYTWDPEFPVTWEQEQEEEERNQEKLLGDQ